jgi:hypothetical protein
MPAIPAFMLKKLYVKGSLGPSENGFKLALKNTLAPGTIIGFNTLTVDGQAYPLDQVKLTTGDKSSLASEVSSDHAYAFPLGGTTIVEIMGKPPAKGSHNLVISVNTREVGELRVEVSDTI